MLGKLALLLKSKVAVAVLGAVLVAGGGTTVALAATGAPIQLPILSQGQNHSNDGQGNAQKTNHDDGQQAEGVISSIDNGNNTFVVAPEHGSSVTVAVNDKTVYEGGLNSFADLKVGQHVETKGTLQSDGSLLASKIEGQNENANDKDGQDGQENDLKGTVGSIDSAHSSFVLQMAGGASKTIQVSSNTSFDGGFNSFADIKVGMTVEVKGNLQSDGSVAASDVQRDDSGSSGDHSGDSGTPGTSGSGDSSGSGSSGSGSSGTGDSAPNH